MTAASASHADLMARRMALVASISALNAEALKLIQRLGALDMETMRLEMEMARGKQDDELVRALHEAEASADALRAEQIDCEARIAVAEREVDATDRLLTASEARQEEDRP